MNGYLVGALVAVAVAGYFWWEHRTARAMHLRLVSVEASTTGALVQVRAAAVEAAGAGSFRERVELAGFAHAGPHGLLTAPLSDTPCVWHRHTVTRRYREVTRESSGERRTTTREEVVTDEQSHEPFLLRDADGEVLIQPAAGSISGTRKSVSRFEDRQAGSSGESTLGDRETLGYEYQEWVLLPEVRVFVSGEATDASGELIVHDPEGSDKLVVTTSSEDELVEAAGSAIRRNALCAAGAVALAVVLLVLGLTLG